MSQWQRTLPEILVQCTTSQNFLYFAIWLSLTASSNMCSRTAFSPPLLFPSLLLPKRPAGPNILDEQRDGRSGGRGTLYPEGLHTNPDQDLKAPVWGDRVHNRGLGKVAGKWYSSENSFLNFRFVRFVPMRSHLLWVKRSEVTQHGRGNFKK